MCLVKGQETIIFLYNISVTNNSDNIYVTNKKTNIYYQISNLWTDTVSLFNKLFENSGIDKDIVND